MSTKPWIEGPLELLKHGLEHLQLGSDFDTRIAMISIDNGIELMIKTYLGLPSRVTGIAGLPRKKYKEIIQNFPNLLDGFEKSAPDKIVGIELGDIEWFHRLRNQLYHEGNGITVEREKVEGYAEIAKILFSNLFGDSVEDLIENIAHSLVGEFFSSWASLEQELIRLKGEHAIGFSRRYEPPIVLVRRFGLSSILSASFVQQFNLVHQFRNKLAHELATPSASDLKDHTTTIKKLLKTVNEL